MLTLVLLEAAPLAAVGQMPIARQQDAIKAEVAALKEQLSLAQLPARRQDALRSLQRLLDVSDITNGRIVGWIASSTRRLLPDLLALLKDAKRETTTEVFVTLSIMAKGCGECLQGYESDAVAVFAELLHQPSRAGGGGGEQPAVQCLKTWIRHVHVTAMLPVAFSAFADRHNRQLRLRALECIVFFLEEWPATQMARHGTALERVLQEGLNDARLNKLARRGAELFAARHATGQGQRGAALQQQGLDKTVAREPDLEEDSQDDWLPGGVQMTVNIAEDKPRRGVPRHGRRAATAERGDVNPSSPQGGAPTMMQQMAAPPAPAPRVDPTSYASLCETRARDVRARNPQLLAPPPSSSEGKRRPSCVEQPKEKVKAKPALPRQARGKVMGPTLLGIGYTGSEWRSVDEDKAARVGAHRVAEERARRVSAPADLLRGPMALPTVGTSARREGEKYLEGVVTSAGGGAVATAGSKPKGRRRKPTSGCVGYKPAGPALPASHPLYRGGLDVAAGTGSRGGAGHQALAEICAEEAEAQASLASLNAALGTKRANGFGHSQQHPQEHPQQQQKYQYQQQWAEQQSWQPQPQHQQSVAPNWTYATHMHHVNPSQNQQWQAQQRDEQAWILQRQEQLQQQAQAQLGSGSMSAPPVVGPCGVYAL